MIIKYFGKKGPEIGRVESVTSIPTPWDNIQSQMRYWDCPGFGDTRPVKNDKVKNEKDLVMHGVANAFFIDSLIEKCHKIKVIVVISESCLRDTRSGQFKTLFKSLANFFSDLEQLKSCVVFVVTQRNNSNIVNLKKNI